MDGPKQTKLEKYQNNPVKRNPENTNIKPNPISSNKSLEVKGNINKIPDHNLFPSVNYNPTKQNKSLKNSEQNLLYRTTRIYSSLNKEYSNRDYNTIQTHRQDDSTSFEDSINKNSSKNRYSELNSQSIDNKKGQIIRKNNVVNAEENKYPSNYSYYESKYSKKKITEPEDNDKNTIRTSVSHSINFGYSKNNGFHPNESNNNTLNRSHMITQKSNIINHNMNISPTKNKIAESNYYKIQKDKINVGSNSESSKKGTVIFSNYNNNNYKNNIKSNINNNNTYLKSSNNQPNNSASIYEKKLSSPIKKEEINLFNTNEVKKSNKINSERNTVSKSLEKANIKMLFNQQKKNNMKIKKKLEISEGNKTTINYTKPFKLNMDNSTRSPEDSKIKNASKINTNPNLNIHNANINNNNNNINNNNNNNNHKLNNINKTNVIMNYNNKGNIINKSSVNNHDVNKTNNKSKTLINNNNISNNKVNKNNNTIKNNNNNSIKTNINLNEQKKIVRNINFNTSSKSNLQENIKNISHELKPQPKTQAKEDKDKDKDKEKIVSNEKKQKKSMIQGIKILDIKNNSSVKDSENVSRALPKNKIIDISENNTSRKRQIQNASSKSLEDDIDYFKEVADIMYENNTEPRNQIKYNVKENDIDKKIKFTKGRSGQISEAKIERRFGLQNINENKEKVNTNENSATKGISNIKNNDNNFNTISTSKESIINNRRYSSDIILINNSLKAFNELKRNNSNSKMNNKLIISGTDNKKNDLSNHIKMNSSKNKNNFKLEFLEDKNKQKLQNQSKVSKYESISKRVIDIPKIENKEEKNDDEWDNEQYMGMRKKTYDVGLRLVKKSRFLNKAKKDSSLNNEFSSQTYLKSSDGISIAGKNEYGLKKTNQDTYLIEKNINGILNFNIFGVLDGHGENGHFASQFVSRYILHRIKTHPSLKKEDEPKQIYHKLKENGYEIIANIFVDADVQIQKEKFNVDRSGTTCVIVIQLEEHIICANTGDSRAIIVFDENHDDNLVNSKIYPLSYDCKPELPNELARIIAYGGCVERAYDVENAECGPFRVWAKDKDYPGLAMSRSIGDMDAKKIGVIPNPQIVEYTIDHSSKYLILASDGIWEFIDSEDAMKYSNKYYIRNDPIGLCHDLSKRATALWEKNDCIIDDITVLVVFF